MVLHRDIKPDNIILKNYFVSSDEINVVVLYFDLSWHKGASDFSVPSNALSLGYVAPEQGLSILQLSEQHISTRHAAVDTFSIGMLAYYLLVGKHPRPNEHLFPDFETVLLNGISELQPKWKCIPRVLTEIISKCTKDKQAERIPLDSAIITFKTCTAMLKEDFLDMKNLFLLEEFATRLNSKCETGTKYGSGRPITIPYMNGKSIRLSLTNQHEETFLSFEFSKVLTEHEDRLVTKNLKNAQERGVAALRKNAILKNVESTSGRSQLILSAKWFFDHNRNIHSDVIDSIVEVLNNTICCIDFK